MRLTCPNCGAKYDVDDGMIPPEGRDVQCSNCAMTWFQPKARVPEQEPDEPAETEFAPEAPADPVEAAMPQNPRRAPLDPDVRDVLREEAERERRLREAAAPVESQDEMALDHGAQNDLHADSGDEAFAVDEWDEPRQDGDTGGVDAAARDMAGHGHDDELQDDDLQDDGGYYEDDLADDAPAEEDFAVDYAEEDAAEYAEDFEEDYDEDTGEETGETDYEEAAEAEDDALAAYETEAEEEFEASHAAPEAGPGVPRRELLPDIEEINTTLRSADDGDPDPTVAAVAAMQRSGRRSGLRVGFVLAILLFGGLIAAYMNAPRIAEWLPQARPVLETYVEQVDRARLWLDELAQTTLQANGSDDGS